MTTMLGTKTARSFLSLLLPFLLQAKTLYVSGQEEFFDGALALGGHNRSWFEQHFTDESVMVLPQTGIYKGPDAIMEYAAFTSNITSPYFANIFDVITSPPTIQAFDTISGHIQARVFVITEYKSDPRHTSGDYRFRVATMFSIRINSTTNKVDHVYVYYAESFLEFFFGRLLDSDNTRHFVSMVADEYCSNVITKSNGKHISNHYESLKRLPLTTDGGYVDGNSQGCRALHAAFARNNSNHCPHISLLPTMDLTGQYKCQNSSHIQVLDLFSQEDVDAFNDYILSAESFIENEDGWLMLPLEGAPPSKMTEGPLLSVNELLEESWANLNSTENPLLVPFTSSGSAGYLLDHQTELEETREGTEDFVKFWNDYIILRSQGSRTFFAARRSPGTDIAYAPGDNTISFLDYHDIKERVAEGPKRLVDGTAMRDNTLGSAYLNTALYNCSLYSNGYCGISLGVPVDDHAVIRPALDALFGDNAGPGAIFSDMSMFQDGWNQQKILDSAAVFLSHRDVLEMTTYSKWVDQFFFTMLLGMDPEQVDADSFLFESLKALNTVMTRAPTIETANAIAKQFGVSLSLVTGIKDSFRNDIANAIRTNPTLEYLRASIPPASGNVTSDETDLVAESVLEALLTGGGIPVPQIILVTLGVYYSQSYSGSLVNVNDLASLKLFTLEAIRLFPPVNAMSYIDTSKYYHERSMAWGEPSLPIDLDNPSTFHTARHCPARSLSISMIAGFLKVMQLDQWCVDPETPIQQGPEKFWFKDFKLIRKVDGEACPGVQHHTGRLERGGSSGTIRRYELLVAIPVAVSLASPSATGGDLEFNILMSC